MVVPDPMLLTLRSPAKNEFEFSNSLHDFPAAHRTNSTTTTTTVTSSSNHYQALPKQQASYSPTLEDRKGHRASSSVSDFLSVALAETPNKMTTPHRGLPPPGQLSFPDPSRPSHPPPPPPAPPQQYGSASLAGLPAPPATWQAPDEMRNWLATKAEEEKRRAEEEKRRAEEERSRQEELRLERRKVEQNMLMESIRNGVPPYLIPFFFLSLGGGLSPEWIQQYLGNLPQPPVVPLAQAVHGNSPEAGRSVLPVGYTGVHPQQAQTVPHTPVTAGGTYTFPVAPRQGNIQDPAAGQPRGPFPTTILPRLATGEVQMHGGAIGSTQQSAGSQQQEQSSPIHFHHWQPPTISSASASGAKEQAPATPSEYTSSPKKRKATGLHQPAPAPSRPAELSSTGSGRRTGHARHRSDVSARAVPDGPPRTPMERQETPTQQQWHHHHAPAAGPPPPPPPPQSRGRYDEQSLGQPGPSESGTPFDSRRSSQPQMLSGAQSTPASDDRPGTSEDIEMSER